MESIHSPSPDFDFPDSASAISSTLVLTPHSGQNVSKWHADRIVSSPGSSVVDNSSIFNPSPKVSQPQPPPTTLRLLALRPNPNRDPMFQNHGKGPVQPHVNNLPRRRPGAPRKPAKTINSSTRRQGRIATSSSSDSSSSKPLPKTRNSSSPHDQSSGTGVADSASVHSTRHDSSSSSPAQRRPHSPSHSHSSNSSSHSHAAQHSERSQDSSSNHGRVGGGDGDGPHNLTHTNDHDHIPPHLQRTRSGSYVIALGRLSQIHNHKNANVHNTNGQKRLYYTPSSSPSIIAANRLLSQPLFDANVNNVINMKEASSVTLNEEQQPGFHSASAKGHVQPHFSNIPRRTRGKGRFNVSHARDATLVENVEGEAAAGVLGDKKVDEVEVVLTQEELKAKRRGEWEEERCFQEMGQGSGIWVGFSRAVVTNSGWIRVQQVKPRIGTSDSDSDSGLESGLEKEKELVSNSIEVEMKEKLEAEEEAEFVEGASERVIRVCLGGDGVGEEEGDGDSAAVEGDGKVMKLCIPGSLGALRDDGAPHLTRKQVEAVRGFLSGSGDEAASVQTSLESTPNASYSLEPSSSSSSGSSTLVSPTPSPELRLRRVCILVPLECAIDAIVLGVLLHLGFFHTSSQPSLQSQTSTSSPSLSISQKETLQSIEDLSGSRVLAFLSRLHDVEGLQLVWRGLLSCDGIEWVEDVLASSTTTMLTEREGPDEDRV
ncbi:hypothetical protein D9758_006631 [Tetrapyrgos nigripes]|uniref:Uncharacterized protein n=1 Tax=Tetrapyrgos nigripes TaxID=182062 RepID=A0A8H5GJ27_9AGAR|nr:hypothetical protein D9758_006631 [Tetrapyrgos nigripes]